MDGAGRGETLKPGMLVYMCADGWSADRCAVEAGDEVKVRIGSKQRECRAYHLPQHGCRYAPYQSGVIEAPAKPISGSPQKFYGKAEQ